MSETKIIPLSRDAILNAEDRQSEVVHVPEWSGHVYIRTISSTERDEFEASLTDEKGQGSVNLTNIRAKLVCLAAVDAEGNRLFSETDAPALGQKAGKALARLFPVAQRLAGMTDEDLKEMEGNS